MPSIVLGGQIPYTVLSPNASLFHQPPKIFSWVCYVHILGLGSDKLIPDPLNVFFLGILVLRKDTDITHLLFSVISLVLMSHLMNLSPISLLRLLVTVLLLVFLSYHLCLLLNLLINHSRYIVVGRNLQQRLLPHLLIRLLILPLF